MGLQTPLTDLPPDPEEILDLIDPDLPLAELPQTGLSAAAAPLLGFGLAALGLGLLLDGKKKDEDIV